MWRRCAESEPTSPRSSRAAARPSASSSITPTRATHEVTPEEREAFFEKLYGAHGFGMFALDVQLAASNLHYGLAAVTVWRLADGITGENSYLGGAYRRLWKDFECEPRNDIEVKAVGILKTFFLGCHQNHVQ